MEPIPYIEERAGLVKSDLKDAKCRSSGKGNISVLLSDCIGL